MKLGVSLAESDCKTQFSEVRKDLVLKSLYRALCEAVIIRDLEVYKDIQKIISRELAFNYNQLLKPKYHEWSTRELENVKGAYVPEIYAAPKRSYIKDFAKTAIELYFDSHANRTTEGKRQNRVNVRSKDSK